MNKTIKNPRKQTKKQTRKQPRKQTKQELRVTFKRKRSYRPRMKRYIKLSNKTIPKSVKLGSMEEHISINSIGEYVENKKLNHYKL
jgi:hypothetical protein